MWSRYIDMDGTDDTPLLDPLVTPLVTGHAQPITSLAVPPPSLAAPLMATTSQDGVLRIWQAPPQPANWHQVCPVTPE